MGGKGCDSLKVAKQMRHTLECESVECLKMQHVLRRALLRCSPEFGLRRLIESNWSCLGDRHLLIFKTIITIHHCHCYHHHHHLYHYFHTLQWSTTLRIFRLINKSQHNRLPTHVYSMTRMMNTAGNRFQLILFGKQTSVASYSSSPHPGAFKIYQT